jgi:reactive intermediate/imine deaminase
MAKRAEFRVAGLNEPISHYTDVVRFGNHAFISGMAPLDADGKLVGGDDIALQTRKVFANIEKALEAIGERFKDILKVTVYLTDVNDRGKINPVRKEYFGEAKPASTLIGVKELAVPGMKVEIEAIVGLPGT